MNETISQDRENQRLRLKKLHKKRAQNIYRALSIVFCVCLILVIAINFITPDSRFSSSENRVLSQEPEFTFTSLMNGSYMSDFESYVSDQFFMRDEWITLKLNFDKALGKKESNGVYLGKDRYLMSAQSPTDQENLTKNLKAIQDFYARYTDLNISMTLVPNACYVLKNLMPANAPVPDQEKEIAAIRTTLGNSVNFLDVTSALQLHANEYIYYKTDHHWTTLGASYAFEAMADGLGLEGTSFEYNTYTVTNSFSGTLASKSGYHGTTDYIEVYAPANDSPDYIVTYADTMKQSSSLYDSSCLDTKDKYTVFFGGNHTLIDIQTTNETNRVLLMFKDSYANCFIPFLVPYYSEIIVVDPRYYYDSIDQIIERNSVTDVLYLYNLDTFLSDSSLADTLAADEQIINTDETNTSAGNYFTTDTESESNTDTGLDTNSDIDSDTGFDTNSDIDSDTGFDTDSDTNLGYEDWTTSESDTVDTLSE